MKELSKIRVFIRGAGELASATALTLHRAGFQVIMTELDVPFAIRWTVSFSEAIIEGKATVENVQAVRTSIDDLGKKLNQNIVPIVIDSADLVNVVKPDIYVDARMLKAVVTDRRNGSYFTIGLGPGFTVGDNCDAVIETMRGHDLGEVLWDGSAQENTGIPGEIGGESARRVIHAKLNGELEWMVNIGDLVKKDQVIGKINEEEFYSQIDGLVRGLISPQVKIKKGMKIADIDPRGKNIDYKTISDKARNIGRGVLEAILVYLNNGKNYITKNN